MFVVIEGGDAVGKHTVVTGLYEWALARGMHAYKYSFPRYKTAIGQVIEKWLVDGTAKEDPLAFQAMMTTDRYDAAVEIAELSQRPDTIVICDRWWQSGYVYGKATGLDPDFLFNIHAGLPKPDLNILLDIPSEEASLRRPEKRDSYERDHVLLKKVEEGYRRLWSSNRIAGDDSRWSKLNASESVGNVFGMVVNEIATLSEARGEWGKYKVQG